MLKTQGRSYARGFTVKYEFMVFVNQNRNPISLRVDLGMLSVLLYV